MTATAELHRCDRCCEAFPWDELDAVVIPGYSLLCGPCIEEVRRERMTAARAAEVERCSNCGTSDPAREVEGRLCARCFRAMPEGVAMTPGTWDPAPAEGGEA